MAQLVEQTQQTRPISPLTITYLTPSCFTNHTPNLLRLPAALAARYAQGQAARARGVGTHERGVLSTPPPLLKQSPQEARCTEGVGQGEFQPNSTYLLHLPAALAARYAQGQAARARGADTHERGVLSTPPPLLKHSPQEARYKEGV